MESLPQLLIWTLIHSLWWALVIWMITSFIKSRVSQSRIKRSISLIALFLFTGAIFSVFPLLMDVRGAAANSASFTGYSSAQLTWYHQLESWITQSSGLLSILWLTGLTFGILKIWRSRLMLKTYAKTAITCEDAAVLKSTTDMIGKLGIGRKVQIFISPLVDSPMTIGFFKPIIYFPAGMISGFNYDELDTILYHELIHIKRSDYLINLMLVILETIFFFNPFLLMMIKELRLEMELVCDDQVIKNYEMPIYVQSLLKLQEYRMGEVIGLAAKNNNSEFKKRISNMMNKQTHKSRPALGIVSLIMVIVLCCSAFISKREGAKDLETVDKQQDTIRFKTREEMASKIKEMEQETLIKSVLMVDGKPIRVVTAMNNPLQKGEDMMNEIQNELIKDGILSESRPKVTLMFQYSDLLNGKEVLDDKYEKYKGIFNRYFPRYDSYATTRVFRLK